MPDQIDRQELLESIRDYLSYIQTKEQQHMNDTQRESVLLYQGMLLGITGCISRIISQPQHNE
jgi:hypothetical protein